MGPTTLPAESQADEKPRPMVYDGWDFVPLVEADPAPPAEADVRSEAA